MLFIDQAGRSDGPYAHPPKPETCMAHIKTKTKRHGVSAPIFLLISLHNTSRTAHT